MASSKITKSAKRIGDNLMPKEIPPAAVKVEIEGTFWVTRDKRMGILSDVVEVWLVKPDLYRFDDGDVMWMPSLEHVDKETTHYAEWSLAKTLKEIHTIPETERECIRVGP